MLCLLEGQPPNLLTFSRQIDVKHYVHEKLTFLMVWMWRHLNDQTKKVKVHLRVASQYHNSCVLKCLEIK